MEMGGGEPQKDSIIAEFSKSEGNLASPDTVKSNGKIRNDMNRTTKNVPRQHRRRLPQLKLDKKRLLRSISFHEFPMQPTLKLARTLVLAVCDWIEDQETNAQIPETFQLVCIFESKRSLHKH